MNDSNRIDLVDLITKNGTEAVADFEGFLEAEEKELIIKEIKKCSKIFSSDKDPNFIQDLCDIVLIKLFDIMNCEDISLSESVDKILDLMVFWEDVVSCRYLIKSGIDWSKIEA